MNEQMKTNIQSADTWRRALYMLLFALIWTVTETVLVLLVMFQLGSVLITGTVNANVARLGRLIGLYLYQIVQFVTFNNDEKPFPFGVWPDVDSDLKLPEKK